MSRSRAGVVTGETTTHRRLGSSPSRCTSSSACPRSARVQLPSIAFSFGGRGDRRSTATPATLHRRRRRRPPRLRFAARRWSPGRTSSLVIGGGTRKTIAAGTKARSGSATRREASRQARRGRRSSSQHPAEHEEDRDERSGPERQTSLERIQPERRCRQRRRRAERGRGARRANRAHAERSHPGEDQQHERERIRVPPKQPQHLGDDVGRPHHVGEGAWRNGRKADRPKRLHEDTRSTPASARSQPPMPQAPTRPAGEHHEQRGAQQVGRSSGDRQAGARPRPRPSRRAPGRRTTGQACLTGGSDESRQLRSTASRAGRRGRKRGRGRTLPL